MGDFIASVDRKKLFMNLIGYTLVFGLTMVSEPQTGFMGRAINAYLWAFPIYYVAYLVVTYMRKKGHKE